MRGETTRLKSQSNLGGDQDGRNPPHVSSNGSSTLSPPSALDSSSQHPGLNGANTSSPHGRANTFSYSSILTSAQHTQSTNDTTTGNGTANHDKPFKYSRDEMLNIWKSNAQRIKSNGIPLEFEKHDVFTSENTLDPVLLTEMNSLEKEVS
jgi:hypothetical protein